MPKKQTSHHRRGRSPTPSSNTESDVEANKLRKKKQSSSKSTSRHKGKHDSHSKKSRVKEKAIPNQHDLETVDTSEIKQLTQHIHLHLRILMRRPDATSAIPPPPTSAEKRALENQYADSDYPDDLAPFLLPSNPLIRITTQVSDTFYNTLEMTMQRWGLARYTFDWDGNFDDTFNQISLQFFLKTFGLAVRTLEYGIKPLTKFRDPIQLSAIVYRAFKTLRAGYKAQINNPMILKDRRGVTDSRREKENRLTEYREFMKLCGVCREIASIFKRKNYMIMGDVEEVEIKISGRIQKERRVYHPQWWSDKMISFMKVLETNIQFSSQLEIKNRRRGKRATITYVLSPHQDFQNVPEGLPFDLYNSEFLMLLVPAMRKRYQEIPSCLPTRDEDMMNIFPQPADMISYDSNDSLASLSTEDTESSQSDRVESDQKSDEMNASDIEMSYENFKQSDKNKTIRDITPVNQVASSSNVDLISDSTSNSANLHALTLYHAPPLDTNTPFPSDAGPITSNSKVLTEVEELQIALRAKQAMMDQEMSELSTGIETKLKMKLEAERRLMYEAFENEKRQLSEEQDRLVDEKKRMISELDAQKRELKAEQDKINAEKQLINAALIAEKNHIDAVVAAEKDRIDAAVTAEKESINAAVTAEKNRIDVASATLLAEKKQLEAERRQLMAEQGAHIQVHCNQPGSVNFEHSPNHSYPPGTHQSE